MTKVADGLVQRTIGVTGTLARRRRGLTTNDSTENEALGKEAKAHSEVNEQAT